MIDVQNAYSYSHLILHHSIWSVSLLTDAYFCSITASYFKNRNIVRNLAVVPSTVIGICRINLEYWPSVYVFFILVFIYLASNRSTVWRWCLAVMPAHFVGFPWPKIALDIDWLSFTNLNYFGVYMDVQFLKSITEQISCCV